MNKILNSLILFNIILIAYAISTLESDIVPIHYNAIGTEDSWGNKWILLTTSFIPLIISIIFYFYKKAPRNMNSKKNKKYENLFILGLIIFFIIISWISVIPLYSQNPNKNKNLIYYISIALAFLIIDTSILMPKIEQNRSFGIRTPWTLKDNIIWAKTNKLAGIVGQICGYIIIVNSLIALNLKFKPLCIYTLIITAISFIFIPLIYSYVLYKKILQE